MTPNKARYIYFEIYTLIDFIVGIYAFIGKVGILELLIALFKIMTFLLILSKALELGLRTRFSSTFL